jgi:hypothetical protein
MGEPIDFRRTEALTRRLARKLGSQCWKGTEPHGALEKTGPSSSLSVDKVEDFPLAREACVTYL